VFLAKQMPLERHRQADFHLLAQPLALRKCCLFVKFRPQLLSDETQSAAQLQATICGVVIAMKASPLLFFLLASPSP
jgi:hypothetical protein